MSAEIKGSVAWQGKVSVGGAQASWKATAEAGGEAEIGSTGTGLEFAGSIGVEGSVKCYVGNRKVASAGFDVGGEINDDELVFGLTFLGT